MHRTAITGIFLLGVLLTGCAVPSNPSFPLTRRQARLDLDAMARNPKRAARPVLFLGAYMDAGYATAELRTQLGRVISDDRFLTVTFLDCRSFDECRERLIEKVEREFPSHDPLRTIEVDAVGTSMGGLVGRHAAQPSTSDKQLRVVRLFTIATPHRGAMLGTNMYIDPLARRMRSGSSFIEQLNRPANQGRYQLIPYVWTNDNIVGAGNAAPPGMTPWWLPPVALQAPHMGPMHDPRVIADIARRLRGEKPYTVGPPAPLPPGATAVGPPASSCARHTSH
jgi:hypothetical protein